MQGVYRHYKGGLYTVLMRAVGSDNGDEGHDVVVYVSHTTGLVCTRKAKEFFGHVVMGLDKDGAERRVNRFEFWASSLGPPEES